MKRFARARLVRARLVPLLFLAPTAACFSYRAPGSGAAVPEGAVVRVRLQPGAADSLAIEVGPHVSMVAGHLVSDAGDVLSVRGETVTRLDGADDLAASTIVHIPRRLVSSIEVRRLDRVKTALLAGGIVAVTIAVRGAAGSTSGGGGGGVPGGGK